MIFYIDTKYTLDVSELSAGKFYYTLMTTGL